MLIAIALVAVACGGATTNPPAPTSGSPQAAMSVEPKPSWRTVPAPLGAPSGGEWIAIGSDNGATILAAVIRPTGAGPWPVAVFLHGSDGLRGYHLDVAGSLAKEGFLTVVPCWVRGAKVEAENLGCVADARRITDASPSSLLKDVSYVSDAARTLRGGRADRLLLVGHSLGGWAASAAVSMGQRADAVVSMSGTYGPNRPLGPYGALVKDKLDALASPLLIVHGTHDELWPVDAAREYEKTARERGKAVEAIYVDGAPHGFPYMPQFWTETLRAKVVGFLKAHV